MQLTEYDVKSIAEGRWYARRRPKVFLAGGIVIVLMMLIIGLVDTRIGLFLSLGVAAGWGLVLWWCSRGVKATQKELLEAWKAEVANDRADPTT